MGIRQSKASSERGKKLVWHPEIKLLWLLFHILSHSGVILEDYFNLCFLIFKKRMKTLLTSELWGWVSSHKELKIVSGTINCLISASYHYHYSHLKDQLFQETKTLWLRIRKHIINFRSHRVKTIAVYSTMSNKNVILLLTFSSHIQMSLKYTSISRTSFIHLIFVTVNYPCDLTHLWTSVGKWGCFQDTTKQCILLMNVKLNILKI
jgi:hypothetical protein